MTTYKKDKLAFSHTNPVTTVSQPVSPSQTRLQCGGISELWIVVGSLNDWSGSPGGDRYGQQDKTMTVVCCSQQPQSPTWKLEPRQLWGRWSRWLYTSATGYRDRRTPAQTVQPGLWCVSPLQNPILLVTHMRPCLPLWLSKSSTFHAPSLLLVYQLFLFRALLTTPICPHLKCAVLQYNHLCMWVEEG